MDYLFEKLREKMLLNKASVGVVVVIGDQVLTGIPTSTEGFTDRTNETIEALASALAEDDPLRAGTAGLRFDSPGEEDLNEPFIALRDAVLKRPLQDIEMGTIRVDLRAVTAWGVLAPEDSDE